MLFSFKQIVSLILLSVFLLQIFSRFIICADYIINKDYIAKVLCINKDKPRMRCEGKCHLKKQLDKEEKKEQSPTNPIKEKNEIQFFSESNSVSSFVAIPLVSKQISVYSFSLSEKHTLTVFHPPIV